MTRKIILPLLALVLAVQACNFQPTTTVPASPVTITEPPVTPVISTETPIPTVTMTDTPIPPAPAGLTSEVLRNATYTITGFTDTALTVTLVNGSYVSGSDPAVEGYISVFIGDLMAFGDLNYDGVNDAAVILGINTGGTGVFTYIASVLDVGGMPVHAASIFIDDRPMINGLVITSGEILAQTVIHDVMDPGCCPGLPVEQGYRLYNDNLLVHTRWAGQTPGGMLRAINITDPLDLADSTYPLIVNGNVTVGPFENTLAYNVYTPDNTLVTSGSVMTNSANPGDPGNFSLTLDLSMAGVYGLVRIEFAEVSMMDGSTMTLDSVLVTVH